MTGASIQPAPDQPTSPLRVIMVPFDPVNPYQRMLKKGLGRLGVDVRGGKAIRGLPLSPIGWFGRDVDVVHLHWLGMMLGPGRVISLVKSALFLGHLIILRCIGKRIVWTAHNIRPHDVRYPTMDRTLRLLVLKLVHSIVVHCEAARREVAREFKLSDGKIHVIPHGHYGEYYPNHMSRIEARGKLELDANAIVMLFLGHVRPYKGVTRLIDAFRKLALPEATLVIAGKPLSESDESAVRDAIGSHPAIRFYPGLVPDDEIQVFMNAADFVVFPYRDVLTSGAVVLAMSFGRACVAPQIGCIGEVLTGPGAILYDPADEEGLENAMRYAVERRENLVRMGECNRERIMQWGWDRIAAATQAVYVGSSSAQTRARRTGVR